MRLPRRVAQAARAAVVLEPVRGHGERIQAASRSREDGENERPVSRLDAVTRADIARDTADVWITGSKPGNDKEAGLIEVCLRGARGYPGKVPALPRCHHRT